MSSFLVHAVVDTDGGGGGGVGVSTAQSSPRPRNCAAMIVIPSFPTTRDDVVPFCCCVGSGTSSGVGWKYCAMGAAMS